MFTVMRILYIITSMYNSAGMERTVANKANYLINKGHDVSIVTTDQNGRDYFYKISNKVKRFDLNLNYSNHDSKNILIRTLLFLYKNLIFKKRLKALLYANSYDIVITLVLKSTDFLYQINDGSIKIVEHHFSREHYEQLQENSWNNILIRFAYKYRDWIVLHNLKKYDRFVVLTEEDAIAWRKSLHNVSVIPNSINYREHITANLDNKQIISIGRLEYQKGYDILIPIWAKIVCKHPDWKLCIYGAGSMISKLLAMIDSYGLKSSVFIKSPVSDVDSVLLDSSIYLLTSRFEGLPMVLLESMALGVPPVAFHCKCGPKDVIEDGINGFLVEKEDYESFIDKVLFLIENDIERKKMGLNSKARMLNYSHEYIGQKWENLFCDLLNSKRK